MTNAPAMGLHGGEGCPLRIVACADMMRSGEGDE